MCVNSSTTQKLHRPLRKRIAFLFGLPCIWVYQILDTRTSFRPPTVEQGTVLSDHPLVRKATPGHRPDVSESV